MKTLSYWALTLSSVFFICSAGSCALGFVQKVQAQEIDPKTIKPIDNKADIEKAVNQLVKIHEFCWENKGCMVLRTEDYKRDQEELKVLRQKAKEQCS
jgi:hypothetical protein